MGRSFLPLILFVFFLAGFSLPAAVSALGDSGTAGTIADSWVGKSTASGEKYDPEAFTATGALRLGLRIAVTNPANGRTVTVRIIDTRTPPSGRLLDVSRAAAAALGFPEEGAVPVEVKPLKADDPDVTKVPAPPSPPPPLPAPLPEATPEVAAPVPVPARTELPPPPQAYFQLGAFRTEWNAQSLARSLVRHGNAPMIFHEGGLFRVYLQTKEADAAILSDKLTHEGRSGFFQVFKAPSGTPVTLSSE
jgi:rare lipoprotein A